MRHRAAWAGWSAVVSLLLIGTAPSLASAGNGMHAGLAALVARAAGGDLVAARLLREVGPLGLSALVDAGVAEPGRAEGEGYRRALNVVCAQVGCGSSHLYWYTDFTAAQREAESSGKPILALRLLGRLDEELSCANSRYFRLVLYSDPSIAGWLREHVVLYWSSERPVPRVTIDYGDGRRLVGTVTGNSIHYLLDPHGRLVDALPGLNAPHRFLAWLQASASLAGEWAPLADAPFLERLQAHHALAEGGVIEELAKQLMAHGWGEEQAWKAWGKRSPRERAPVPTAAEAAVVALSKSVAERPTLAAIGPPPPPPADSPAIVTLVLAPEWHAELSPASLELVEAQAPPAARADLEAARIRMVNRLSEDGLRNEAFLHRSIHARLAQARSASWTDLNAWVYSDLFLSPASDPWLGLASTELLSALAPAP